MIKETETAVEVFKELAPEVYKDVAKPSLQAMGKALGNVIELVALPISGLNYWSEKAKILIAHNLDVYRKKLDQIEPEKVQPVAQEIGVPIFEKLRYTANKDLVEMFTNLLASASSFDAMPSVHPAFVDIISRLSPEEAKILAGMKRRSTVLWCTIKGMLYSTGYNILKDHATDIDVFADLTFKENEVAYMSNLVGLGLFVEKQEYLTENSYYDAICTKNGIEEMKATLVPSKYKTIKVEKGLYEITPFGKMFLKACVR